MPYKNDDLEILFKKAAKNYPLKTDNSDWDDLASRLNSSVALIETKKKKRKYAAIFALFVVGSIVLYKFQFSSNSIEKQADLKQRISKQVSGKNETSLSPKINEPSTAVIQKPDLTVNCFIPAKNQSISVIKNNSHSVISGDIEDVNPLEPDNSNNSVPVESEEHAGNSAGKQEERIANRQVAKNLNENNNKADESLNTKEVRVRLKPSYRIYGTFYGGPQFSMVKFQHVSNPGYRLGVSLGFRISRRFSAELKLQREHINFYSNGTYIDTTLLRIKPNTSIEKANASSKITSVPIAVRYNFSSKGSGHFFVTAGVNAVIITHDEQYNYEVSKNGVEGNLSRKYNSLKTPKYFQGVNASAGFETKLIKWCNIKIEPYYQTPVNNFGVGKLPVSNFGVDIGIVKNLK